MSTTRKGWKRIQEASPDNGEDFESMYADMFGPLFYKGLDIGHQVVAKLMPKGQKVDGNTDRQAPWPTLLQAEGLDSGLTAGFLNVCGISVIGEDSPFDDLAVAIYSQYGARIIQEIIETHEQLTARYPEYATIPDEQQWTLPGVMIHYISE